MKYAVILLRYLKGYVHIRATGGFPERFINLCHSRKINLWDVFLSNNVLTFCVSRNDYPILRSLSRKSGVKLSITKKTGLVYRYRKHNKRIGMATGVMLFLIIHLLLSMFVWCVNVKGNTTLSKTEIIQRAEAYGLSAGTFKKGFDEVRTARNIATDCEGKITWLSVNIKGSMAVIELREDNRIIGETEDRPPCNIVADFDGVILSAQTFYGDCMVKSGNGVKKGDLLINGAIINEDMSTTFYAARGRITALHEVEIRLSEKITETAEKVKITGKSYSIGIFGLNFPLRKIGVKEDVHCFTERKTLSINGFKLPFHIEKNILYSREKAQAENHSIHSLEKIQHSIYTRNANSTVTESEEKLSAADSSFSFSGKYNLIDFLGEEKPILSEK